jgi:hypothetical protein
VLLNAAIQEQIIAYAANAHVIAKYRILVVDVYLITPDRFKYKDRILPFVTCGKRTKNCDEKHEVA